MSYEYRGDFGRFVTAYDVKLLLLSLGLLLGATAIAGAALAVPRLRLLGGGLAVVASVVWLGVNSRLEGPLLIAFGEDHGLVLADLLVLPPGLLVLAIVVLELRERRREGPTVSL